MSIEQEPLFELLDDAPAERLPAPGGRAFTVEQSEAIRARAGSRLLYANAGSGKTAVIVERFVGAVLEDGTEPSRILAITFTDKAAGELKQRLRERFLELGERDAARDAEAAYVSTIHGFCTRLLRAHPFAAGIDPAFRVLDEAEGRRLRADSFSAALAAFLDAAAGHGPAALELAAAYRPDRLAKLIGSTYEGLRSRGERVPALPPVTARLVPPDAPARLLAAAAGLERSLAGAGGAMVERALSAVARCQGILAAAGDAHPLPAQLAEGRFKPGGAKALDTQAATEYLDALDAYAAAVADELAVEACGLLGDLLAQYGTEYERRKRLRSGLDFEDLELLARDVLREHPAVRRAYSERFALVMVDEFQDTNARQLDILGLLDRDNLLTVGDEFQSIYGFRHADVSIFRRRRGQLAEGGRTASLSANFRSRGPLLDVVNAAFAPIFGEAFVPLADGRDDAREVDGPLVELLVTDQRDWDETGVGDGLPPAAAWRAAEARLLARRVRQLVDGGEASPGEVAVLVRALGDLPMFERALEEAGLSTYVAGARGYWSAQQVRDTLAYLGALANPRDEGRLFELLASPLAGLSSDGLALLARARRALRRDAWWTLEQAFCPGGDGSDGLAEALPEADTRVLREFCPWFAAERRGAPRHALDELIERAVSARGYDLHALALRGGARRYANVRKLLRLAREYETREGRDLRGFLDWVAVREDADVAEGEAPVETEGLDAVRLMSIHAAKGLEFGVVCVADTGRPGPGETPDLHVGEDGRVGLRLVTIEGDGTPALDHAALQAEAQEAADEEERRVFYVACTRARERLIVSGAVANSESWQAPRSNGPPMLWLARALAPGIDAHLRADNPAWTAPTGVPCTLSVAPGEGLVPAGEPAARPGEGPMPSGQPSAPEEAESPAGGPARPTPLPVRRVSYSGLEGYARCGYRFYLERVLALPRVEPPPADPDEEAGLPAMLRGTLAHELLERLDFSSAHPPVPAAVAALAAQHAVTLSPAEADDLVALVAGFAACALCHRLAAAGPARREAPFAFPLAVDGGEVLVNGVVDVIAREGRRALVVDYKSDHLDDGNDLAARADRDYRTQRVAYGLAALRGGAAEVEVVHCFLERPQAPAAVTFTAADAPALQAELAGLAAGIAAREFPVSERPHRWLCRDCPGRLGLCSWGPEMTLRDAP